ncbi:unnamed protein product [Dicrocoelium dendriticum]|nr:unnamed protein product [Dicrocoelium dendriticum]
MTVSYSRSVATVHRGSLARLLCRWRGSVYKAVWPIFVLFCLVYGILALTYYFLPSNTPERREVKRRFVQVCAYAGHISGAIPVSLVLGFFVNIVVSRWWQQFLNLPTPDSVCYLVATYLRDPATHGKQLATRDTEDRPAMFRRAIARYLNLALAICFLNISLSMKREIGSLDQLMELGLMTKEEHRIYVDLSHGESHFFIPLVWVITLMTRAHHEGMVHHERHLDSMVGSVVEYWKQLQSQFLYDYVNIPLVYNQVVTWVVYLYIATMLLSHQFTDPTKVLKEYEQELLRNNYSSGIYHNSSFLNVTTTQDDLYSPSALDTTPNLPVFALLSLVFYAGWLRVAETNVFPFGEDDDDFESVPLLERNMNASMWLANTTSKEATAGIPNVVKGLEEISAAEEPVEEGAEDKESIDDLRMRKHTPPAVPFGGEGARASTVSRPSIVDLDPNPASELPCPEDLRRRSSKFFFAGSMARLAEEDLPAPSSTRRASRAYRLHSSQVEEAEPDYNLLHVPRATVGGQVGNFFGRVGSRISEIILPKRHSVATSEATSSVEHTDVSMTPPIRSVITRTPRDKTRID